MPWQPDGGLKFAEAALEAYELPEGLTLKLISLSENATFLVSAEDPVGVLRVYRPDYQTDAAKRSELEWIEALRNAGTVATPHVRRTRAGTWLHRVNVDGVERDTVMFEHVVGEELDEESTSTYAAVGSIAARLHLHVQSWQAPEDFERRVWGLEEILGSNAHWGDWRDGPGLDENDTALLEEAEAQVRRALVDYPLDPENSGLVHCDLRAANILADPEGELWVIDFDDSGFSWFLWDLCSSTTFIEHTPQVEDVIDAWLSGYSQVRGLTARDRGVIRDLVFLRRLHILAWMGSHPEADPVRDFGEEYVKDTLVLARKYLEGSFLPRTA